MRGEFIGFKGHMTSKLSRLSAALRGSPAEQEPARTWKARAEGRAARIVELERTIASLECRLEKSHARKAQIDERLHSRRHAVPSPDVLRQVLAVRAAHLPVPAHEHQAAQAREQRLGEVCSEYLAALADPPSLKLLEKIGIDGFDWWVPLDPRVEDRVERAGRQGLPLRAILQTREVGLGGIMLDLGANLGRTSIPRVLLGDARVVYAAEPFPANYAALVRNVAQYGLRGFVVPDQVAIGAERGELEMRVSRYPGGHRLLHKRRHPVETISVQVWPVDQWIERMGVEPEAVTFVKVDTQGSELRVLRGASSLIARRHVAWQIEVDPALLKHAGTKLRDLCALIETHFTHFIDLAGDQRGPRTRSTRLLRESLSYLGTSRSKTDLVLYHALP